MVKLPIGKKFWQVFPKAQFWDRCYFYAGENKLLSEIRENKNSKAYDSNW